MSDSTLSRRLRSWGRDRVKPLEVAGRHLLQWLAAMVLGVKQRPIPPPKTVLVVRLDRRVGNLLLLTPTLRSLKALGVHLTLLCHEDMARLMAPNPLVDAIERYSKWSFFSTRGIPAMLLRLRRQRFDVAIDAGSFFGAAVTHPLITRLSGARSFIGPRREPMWRIYHAPVDVLPEEASDIEQRLQLLEPLQAPRLTEMCFTSSERLQHMAQAHTEFLHAATPAGLSRTIACVVGARIVERRVAADVWAAIATAIVKRGLHVTLVWGPGEKPLAEAVQALVPAAHLAPPSTLDQLAILFNGIHGVVGHDTGTSHLAVAVGGRTFVMFVCEAPTRYGHLGPGRTWIDLRSGINAQAIVQAVEAWMASLDDVAMTLRSYT